MNLERFEAQFPISLTSSPDAELEKSLLQFIASELGLEHFDCSSVDLKGDSSSGGRVSCVISQDGKSYIVKHSMSDSKKEDVLFSRYLIKYIESQSPTELSVSCTDTELLFKFVCKKVCELR